MNEPVARIEQELSCFTTLSLQEGLPDDAARKVFWINLYNAYYQLFSIRDKKARPVIFKDKGIHFTDAHFSLDDVEHGILRKYRWKYSFGYLPQFLPTRRIKQMAVDVIDFGIHFALNCGAKSCPPIAFYSYDKINDQLDLATH